jgi:hypothetical protein
VLADPRVVPNRREGEGDSGTSNRSRRLCASKESRRRVVVGVCGNVVSLDDRRGVSALGPLIDVGWGLDNFDRVRCGETRTPTFEVDETISGTCVSSATA